MVHTATQVNRSRLIVADDHQSVLDTVAAMLASEFDIVGTAHDGGALLEAVRRLDPDIVVLDISMPVFNGLEVARRLRTRGSRTKVVFLTVHDDEDFVHEALAAGAAGYVIKAGMAVDLAHAIHEALAGRTFVSPSITITDSDDPRHTG
jgi:DNA-binding NarL/FixJ family response regulator